MSRIYDVGMTSYIIKMSSSTQNLLLRPPHSLYSWLLTGSQIVLLAHLIIWIWCSARLLCYICKTQIDIQSSSTCPISTSQTSVPQIYVIFQILKYMSFFKFWNWCPILKYMAVSHFLKPTSNDVTDVCPNPNQ